MASESLGVSIPFFCAACKALERQHGNRIVGSAAEEFRDALEKAERIYLAWPIVEKKRKAVRK